uniref:C2H2-type domain-containing protein n=1 Tax=Plectus sambesii TaxID=2011161 RepID=A0A914V8N6_9BILA
MNKEIEEMPASNFDCRLVYGGLGSAGDQATDGTSPSAVADKLADSPMEDHDSGSSSAGSDVEEVVDNGQNGVDVAMADGDEPYVPQQLDTSRPPPNLPSYQPSFLPFNHAYAGFGYAGPPSAQQSEKKPPKNGNNKGSGGFPRRVDRAPRSYSPISFEARNRLAELLREKEAALAESTARLDGVGELLARLRNPEPSKQRLVVADHGVPIVPFGEQLSVATSSPPDSGVSSLTSPCSTAPSSAPQTSAAAKGIRSNGSMAPRRSVGSGSSAYVPLHEPLGPGDVPPPPPHPTDPKEVRRLIRSKMHRCKRCKNRFIERNLYERHLRDRHPEDYTVYMVQQEEEMEQQRLEEIEANRLEELQCGGFIPPASEIAAENFDVDPDKIPLPGELSGGIPARFDRYGVLRQPKRPYRKKISPQCPFCDKRFRNEHSLKKHLAKKHADAIDFVQCTKCFKTLKNAEAVDNHTCELLYVCFECTPIRNLCTEQRLMQHRSKFHRGANSGFRCNQCALKFLTPRKLRKHKKMSHVFTKTYPCHFCEELFTSESSVVTHERIHTGIIKFECKICDFKCNRYVRMEEHRKEEHGYICSICQERLSEWSEMKNHTLVAHGGYLTSENNASYIESPRVWIMFKGE